jgi:hypothetical protein
MNSCLRESVPSADLEGRARFDQLQFDDQSRLRDQANVLRKALGAGPSTEGSEDSLEILGGTGNASVSPYVCFEAIALGVVERLPSLTDQERIAIDDGLASVCTSLANCEKLLYTPIPLGYTRSSVRFLWLWITLLPFALSRTFSDFSTGTWWEGKPLAELPVLLFVMLFISFIFLSIEDIAVQIEEPFAILPLEVQHNCLVRDAERMQSLERWHRKQKAAAEKVDA